MVSNNLVNITNKDFIYNLISQRIASFLPPDLQEIYNSSRQVQMISTDSYFLHYSLYPFLRGRNDDEIMEDVRLFCRQYMDGERYQMLKTITTLDDELSLVYSIALTKYIVGRIRGRLESGEPSKISGKGMGGAVGEMLKGISTLLEGAVEEAENVAKNAEEIRELMGGKNAGREAGTFQKILNLAKQMMFVEDLKKIVDMSKRMMEFVPKATRISKMKGKTGDELSGYIITRQIERALPRELALPDELFMRRLSDGFLAKEKLKVSEGAYYILIDKSGSMVGEKTIWARSVAMAIYRMSKTKRRKYFLRFFDTKVHPDKPTSEPREIVDAILKVQSNGGTDITNAISTAIDDLIEGRFAEYTNTIVIITDGEDVVEDLSKELKKTKASLISVMIQGNNETLKNISDSYMHAELTERGGEKLIRLVEAS